MLLLCCVVLRLWCRNCRGLNVEGESDSWDFGVGAGFYINATVDKWKNWRMYDYITKVHPQPLSSSSSSRGNLGW
jgi:S-formylglutathione hydrolase FrmB